MAVIKEWRCMAHGYFDGPEPTCKHGCSGGMVERVFRTPPSIQSAGYRNMNASLQETAGRFGLANMDNFSGEGQRKADWRTHQRLQNGVAALTSEAEAVQQFTEMKAQALRSTFSKTPRPVGEVVNPNADTRQFGGTLIRDGATGRMSVGSAGSDYAVPLARPRAELAAPAYDGRSAGLPASEA